MRRCPASSAPSLLAALCLAACAWSRGPAPELEVFDELPAAPPALPDETERAAGRFAALALAGRDDSSARILQDLYEHEERRAAEGKAPTGLPDNAHDLQNTLGSRRAYALRAQQMLDEEDLDPALERRLEAYLDAQPLNVAERRLREDRTRKIGSVFNALVAPLSRFWLGGTLHPIETGRAALSSLLIMRSFPEATVQERQALRAYRDFLERNPDAPGAERVQDQVEVYQDQWVKHLHGEALEVAQRAVDAGRPDVALFHLDRADRLIPEDPEVRALRSRATQAVQVRRQRVRRSLGAQSVVGLPLDSDRSRDFEALARAVVIAPPDEVSSRGEQWIGRYGAGPLYDEMAFLSGFDALERGDETSFYRQMREIAELDPGRSNMSRHARRVVFDPARNPYAAYQAARSEARRETLAWLALGNRKEGPIHRELPRPVEWILDLPGFAVAIATTPLRMLQYPTARNRFSGGVLHTGEEYLSRFEHGEHAEEVHRQLERLYAQRGQWSQALRHLEARQSPDRKKIASYRERIAERTLEAASLERRWDVRAAIYRNVAVEYANTRQAAIARTELRDLLYEYTPQQIRLSREFLEEHPELWGRQALALSPVLFDGKGDNGEIAEEGITLIGQNRIQIPLEAAEPLVQAVPKERFARFVALLEETVYHQLLTDERERPVPDPQRDLFFERARLELIDEADTRPNAASEATFLGSHEKFGLVRRRGSVLPVEVVLQGGLEDFGFSAFPRIRLPHDSSDAFLYE